MIIDPACSRIHRNLREVSRYINSVLRQKKDMAEICVLSLDRDPLYMKSPFLVTSREDVTLGPRAVPAKSAPVYYSQRLAVVCRNPLGPPSPRSSTDGKRQKRRRQ